MVTKRRNLVTSGIHDVDRTTSRVETAQSRPLHIVTRIDENHVLPLRLQTRLLRRDLGKRHTPVINMRVRVIGMKHHHP